MKYFQRVLLIALGLMTSVAQADLVASWTFDSDTTESVSGTAGTAIGGAAQTTDDAAVGGGSLNVPDGGGWDSGLLLSLNAATTFTAFVKPDAAMGGDDGVVVGENQSDEPGGRMLRMDLTSFGADIGFVAFHGEDAANLGDGEWHHVAWTLDGIDGDSALYVDGILIGTSDTFAGEGIPALIRPIPSSLARAASTIRMNSNSLVSSTKSVSTMRRWTQRLSPNSPNYRTN